ncbi:PAB-dependent poly(A)-specific ribonuclease subunit 3 [Homalodisca vitripennis]|nr:PAB-dependent poly(A)-specific ribonuclease subunit 3 [Homalodisca vitripennis]
MPLAMHHGIVAALKGRNISSYLLRMLQDYLGLQMGRGEPKSGFPDVQLCPTRVCVGTGALECPTLRSANITIGRVGYADDLAVLIGKTKEELSAFANEAIASLLILRRRSQYLGVWLYRSRNFQEHKGSGSQGRGTSDGSWGRFMANIGGPKQGSGSLLATVVASVVLYAGPVCNWTVRTTLATKKIRYRCSISYSGNPSNGTISQRKIGESWWYEKRECLTHGNADYCHLVLSDIGSFCSYLYRIWKSQTSECWHYHKGEDTAEHTLFGCSHTEKGNRRPRKLEEPAGAEVILIGGLGSSNMYKAFHKENSSGVILRHGNVCHHTAAKARRKFKNFVGNSDHLRGRFKTEVELKNIVNWFNSQVASFYGGLKVVQQYEKYLQVNGDYVEKGNHRIQGFSECEPYLPTGAAKDMWHPLDVIIMQNIDLGILFVRLSLDPTWAETGDRYMLKLFRDYVFHQVAEDGRPWLDMAHVVHCLNKLESGSQEKICLMSRDEQSILVVTYAELRHCLEQSFDEISSLATTTKAA